MKKKVFLKISQNSKENTCKGLSLLIKKLQAFIIIRTAIIIIIIIIIIIVIIIIINIIYHRKKF